jgi:hypothetical protein
MRRLPAVAIGILLCGARGPAALAGPPLPASAFDDPLLALGAPAAAPGAPRPVFALTLAPRLVLAPSSREGGPSRPAEAPLGPRRDTVCPTPVLRMGSKLDARIVAPLAGPLPDRAMIRDELSPCRE